MSEYQSGWWKAWVTINHNGWANVLQHLIGSVVALGVYIPSDNKNQISNGFFEHISSMCIDSEHAP